LPKDQVLYKAKYILIDRAQLNDTVLYGLIVVLQHNTHWLVNGVIGKK